MSNFQPLADRVLVERKAADSETGGGIIIPDAAKELPAEGIVVAVGPGRLLDSGTVAPLRLKVGDRVLFSKYAGAEVDFAGLDPSKDYLILREEDVLGTVV